MTSVRSRRTHTCTEKLSPPTPPWATSAVTTLEEPSAAPEKRAAALKRFKLDRSDRVLG